ncbi:S66 family peptidase [Geodermatophilus sp. URMC 62]|uniref:S66 family peptidase n=1 Tax=Geodermatophilus sp. URMC 62 TaxID=3423414 RepID=UPI00406C2E8C
MAGCLTYPPKPRPGDRVAVLSPSTALPAVFPLPFELGLRRLRAEFGLEPVEFPTTRMMGASPRQRAEDLHAAFADPGITAVLVSIGGDDQLKVLRHLDPQLVAAHPKPVFGYSDATNLLHHLWRLGIVGYHGGAVMVQWGRPGAMHPLTRESLRRALFEPGEWVLPQPDAFTDADQDWAEPAALATAPVLEPAPAWSWHGPPRRVSGPGWGGSLEIVDVQLRTGRWMRPDEEYAGAVLLLETSEELPPATFVARLLMCLGERGLLGRFAAVLVGRAKARFLGTPHSPEQRQAYREEQHQAVLAALSEYAPDAVAVLDVDFGHTDPQLVLPHGGEITVDGRARTITVRY